MTTSSSSSRRMLDALIGKRWAALAERDRIALQGLLVLAVLLMLWFGAWMPTRGALQQARANAAAEQQLQVHLRTNAPRLIAAAHRRQALKPHELPAVLSATAADFGLTIRQLQQRPHQGLAVAVEGAPDDVLMWLQALQSRGVGLAELSLVQQPDGSWQNDVLLLAAAS